MYYEQCLQAATPIVRCYLTDVTKHDKAALDGYSGQVIYALRETGSNIILLDNTHTRRQAEWAEAFTFQQNQHFYIGIAGNLLEVTKKAALDKWRNYRDSNRI